MNASRGARTDEHTRARAERATLQRKLDGLYEAIAEGLRTWGLKQKLEEMEARLVQLNDTLAGPEPTPVRLHPNLSELYRRKVAALAESLEDTEIRTPALDAIRGLIDG